MAKSKVRKVSSTGCVPMHRNSFSYIPADLLVEERTMGRGPYPGRDRRRRRKNFRRRGVSSRRNGPGSRRDVRGARASRAAWRKVIHSWAIERDLDEASLEQSVRHGMAAPIRETAGIPRSRSRRLVLRLAVGTAQGVEGTTAHSDPGVEQSRGVEGPRSRPSSVNQSRRGPPDRRA